MDATTATHRMVSDDPIALNSATLEREIAWLSEVIDTRLKLHFGEECNYADIYELVPPEPLHQDSMYASLIRHYEFDFRERVVLML
ncbi:MAG TPA: hypothetical protein VFJ43_00280, partial [Bacteroidia bacterium]|nr:hypothetical protein [Bacteroidia bacterium]